MRILVVMRLAVSLMIALVAGGLIACEKDDEPPQGLPEGPPENWTPMESFGVEYFFSDSARVTALLRADHIIERKEGEKEDKVSVHYLDQGVEIDFFNNRGDVHSQVKANEGIYRMEKGLAELRGNVVLTNNKDERLETEQLFWDEKKDSIYTQKFVRISTPDRIITGTQGLRANTAFTSYTIFGIRGELEVDESEDL